MRDLIPRLFVSVARHFACDCVTFLSIFGMWNATVDKYNPSSWMFWSSDKERASLAAVQAPLNAQLLSP